MDSKHIISFVSIASVVVLISIYLFKISDKVFYAIRINRKKKGKIEIE